MRRVEWLVAIGQPNVEGCVARDSCSIRAMHGRFGAEVYNCMVVVRIKSGWLL